MGFDVFLQKPSGTNAYCNQQAAETRPLWDLQFVQQYPTTLDCLQFSEEANFHLYGFVNKQNTRF
jgi:hypothetical protein